MTGTWRRHGSEFPALLFIAGYTTVGASFTKMPKVEDFAKGMKEIDGFDIWQALRGLYVWLKTRCDDFPFEGKSIFLEPHDIDIPEAAILLLEMTMLANEGNLPQGERHGIGHYGQCEYHLGCYTDTIRAFLDHLYLDANFDETALGRQMRIATDLQEFFRGLTAIANSLPAIRIISHFLTSLDPAARNNFRSFLEGKMPFTGNFDEALARQWIDEFRKETGILLN